MFKYVRSFSSDTLIGRHFEIQNPFYHTQSLDEIEAENIALGWQTQRNDAGQLIIYSDESKYVQIFALIEDGK